MSDNIRYSIRFIMVLSLLYILSHAFEALFSPDRVHMMIGALTIIAEGVFVMWWIRRWWNDFMKIVDSQIDSESQEFQKKLNNIESESRQEIDNIRKRYR